MGLPASFFEAYPPRRDALHRALASRVAIEDLITMSEADYGHDADKHLAALLSLRDGTCLDEPLAWHPLEVIRLCRDYEGAPLGWRVTVAFAEASLLRYGNVHDPDQWECDLALSVARVCLEMGPEVRDLMFGFLAYGVTHIPVQDSNLEYWNLMLPAILGVAGSPFADEIAEWALAREEHLVTTHCDDPYFRAGVPCMHGGPWVALFEEAAACRPWNSAIEAEWQGLVSRHRLRWG